MQHLRFFLSLFYWVSVRSMRAHPWRVFAVLFGIALGAGVFTSVRLAVHVSLDSFGRSMDLISGKADWVVISPGGRVPETLVQKLQTHPAVEVASPLITTYVKAASLNSEPIVLIGLDPILDFPLRSWQVDTSEQEAGKWVELMRTPFTIFLGERLAQKRGLVAGDTVRLEHVHQITRFQVIGVLKPLGLALVDGGFMALVDIATIQEFTGLRGLVDRIDVRLKPWTTEKDIAQIRALIPPGTVLEAPSEIKETGRTMIGAYQLNLTLLSFVSLFVGMFLVYSLVSLNAASRRRELAILLSLGASSRMILVLILCEGLLLGVVGWLLAIPIGSFLVRSLVQGVSSTISNLFVRVYVEGLQLDIWEILLSFAVTLLISLVAACRPAREATHITPREAMFVQEAAAQPSHASISFTLIGLTLIAITWSISKLPSLPGVPLTGYLSVFILVAGFSLLSPSILRWMGSYLPPLLRRIVNEAAYLGGRYVRDAGGRTAIAVGALITATALFVALAIMVHSFRHTVKLWVQQTVAGDLFLRPMMAGFNQYRDPLPGDVVHSLQQLSGEAELLPYRRVYLRYGKNPYQLEATNMRLFLRYGDFLMLKGKLEEIAPLLIAGQGVLVSEVFFNKTGLGVGQRYIVNLGGAVLDLPVLGIFRDYRTQGGIVYFELASFQELTGDHQWSGVQFFFTNRDLDLEAAAARLRAKILKCCGQHHPLEMASGAQLRRDILRIFDETFAVTTVLLLIALLVAGLGITTTLTVLVLERIRQLNTLTAVGASSGQICTMILWEAIFMITAGEAMGVVCGFFLSHLLIDVINLHSFGWTFLYRVDWSSLFIALPLILATALLAALPSTRLVLKSSPALVLREH